MTKTELAESMAEFLEFVIGNRHDRKEYPDCWLNKEHEELLLRGERQVLNSDDLMEWFWLPDGFFAVWDKLHEEVKKLKLSTIDTVKFWERFNFYMGLQGERRFTAFYTAVHEMKGITNAKQ